MDDATRLAYLRLALRVISLIAIFGVYPLTILWPSGWVWHTGRSGHVHHLYGDVLVLFAIAAVLAFLSPDAARLRFPPTAQRG